MPLFEFKRRSTRRRWLFATSAASLTAIVLFVVGAVAALPGSNFEIDTNANLVVNNAAPSIDWLTGGAGTSFRSGVTVKPDLASGSGDDSFGQGTKEDTAVPTVVSGSIPPNKSDLLTFGVYLETTASGARFLNVFWHRVQEPSGTTNMDFEFNQSSTKSANGITPVRTAGDLLIQYDLSQGGTNPQLFLSRWVTSGAGSQCEASNATPCWGTRVNLSAAGDATGSINTTAIPANQTGGLGNISTRTFGEAQVDFDALTGGTGTCTSFGSAYLKSRSSDSFTAALKDFIAPAATNISNCGTVIIRKQTNPDEDPNTTDFGYTKAFSTSPASANTFTLKDDGVKTFSNVLQGSGYTVDETTVGAGYVFQSVDCSASTGVTPTINGSLVTFAIDNAADVLDCTYTNRAQGTIIVEKITDDGSGAFGFTSNTLTPASFTLTTTGAGALNKDSKTFSNLAPGTYDVAETVPAGWNIAGTPSCDDGSSPASIGLSAGETVTCTFHDTREKGAILITKTRKHAADGSGDHPHPGVTFTVTGGELPAAGVSGVTNASGQICITGLVLSGFVGNYTVTETVPSGYSADGGPQTVAVTAESAGCGVSDSPTTANFRNTPLTDLSVTINSQVNGGTDSNVSCTPDGPSGDTPASGDGTFSDTNLLPGTYTCTIVIDP
jgi:prealbumin domain-containing protein